MTYYTHSININQPHQSFAAVGSMCSNKCPSSLPLFGRCFFLSDSPVISNSLTGFHWKYKKQFLLRIACLIMKVCSDATVKLHQSWDTVQRRMTLAWIHYSSSELSHAYVYAETFDPSQSNSASLGTQSKWTRSSADADNRLDAFSGHSRSTNMVPFHM